MVYITIALLLVIILMIIVLSIFMHKCAKLINEQSLATFLLIRKYNILNDTLFTSLENDEAFHDDINTLSTSIKSVLDNYKKPIKKIYPQPALAEMINSTFKEQIAIEVGLSHKQTISSRDAMEVIIKNVIKTYNFVDEEYIIKKGISLIETVELK